MNHSTSLAPILPTPNRASILQPKSGYLSVNDQGDLIPQKYQFQVPRPPKNACPSSRRRRREIALQRLFSPTKPYKYYEPIHLEP